MATSANPLQGLSIAATVIQLQGLNTTISNSIKGLSEIDTTESSELQAKYVELQGSIQAAISTANSTDSNTLISNLKDYRKQLLEYDDSRNKIIGNNFGSTDFLTAVGKSFLYYATMTIYIVGPLFAFIIMTNSFFDENLVFKLFYGIWGALFYPLTLVYSVFNPPVWRSLIIPLVADDEPFLFLEVWKYHTIIDIDETAKGQLMMRLFSGGILALFAYCFFFNGS